MSKNVSEIEVQNQVFVASVVDEINLSTSIYQRGFLKMIAVAQTHGLEIPRVAESFSLSAPAGLASSINRFARLLRDEMPLIDALKECPAALPASVMEALSVADQRQVLDDVFQKLSGANQFAITSINLDQANDVKAIDMLSRLAGKTVFVLSITSFIMLFIVPQFWEMFEEFGIELPESMQYAIAFANLFTNYWFLIPMVLAVLFFVMAIRSPHFLARYFLRWVPGQWNSPVFSRKIKHKMSRAWNLLSASQSTTDDERSLESKQNVGRAEVGGRREARVVAMASSNDSAAWLLRKMAINKHSSSQQNGYLVLRMFSTVVNVILILFGFLLAVGIFQSLISLIQGM